MLLACLPGTYWAWVCVELCTRIKIKKNFNNWPMFPGYGAFVPLLPLYWFVIVYCLIHILFLCICVAFLFYLLYLCCLNNQHLCHSARKYHLLQLYALNYQGYGLGNPGFDYWKRQYFSLHQNARNDFGSTQPHTQSVAGFLPGDKAVWGCLPLTII